MLRERLLREQPEVVRAALRKRSAGAAAEAALDQWLELDSCRRLVRDRRDELTQMLHSLRRTGITSDIRAVQRELHQAKAEVVTNEAKARRMLTLLPNIPDERVSAGSGPSGTAELWHSRQSPVLPSFFPQRHDRLGVRLGIMDLPRATRLSGPRFPLLVGMGARLARALAAFMLDLHTAGDYVEIAPPHLLRGAALEGTGHLPEHEDELYSVPRDGLWLSPTAEAQLVALHAGETIPASRLPLAYTACTPAFRREAGAAGSAAPGLLRQHQFDKVELVRISIPEDTDQAFDKLVADAEGVLQQLELPYRVVALPAGDLPFASQRTYDLEVWMPGQQSYVEISSISDCGPFQAHGLNLRYRPSSGRRLRYPHTLNASALAIGRTVAALLENGQCADASVVLPKALATYVPELILLPNSNWDQGSDQ
ncbi:MAG: serine--tRNA ligase [Ktedonobacterales bacterium]